ncbi:SEC-C domain-containing protein [Clostridium sp. 19966]|uniref:SEC-C metal-binding domain-containing protein n=1 Tax=Clostridium sp. 19966 TaxID=2768166 RepID=UPI0028DFF2D2|nr:SEC-C metal-binding domain-containing protein [Clostridium sp. 19966]MDT8718683.1 SEC-C domain-containing protein [Clostridium sp. 19966]
MSLYKDWTDMVVDYVKKNGEASFWKVYGEMEIKIYTDILVNHTAPLKGTIQDLAKKYDATPEFFMGFIDGINDSLVESYDIESLEVTTELALNVDFEKLYFNMLDAKADYLYTLPQWEAIFSKEKRDEILRSWKDSKTIVKEKKIGRNDPCPCGSGKKYKKCCGAKEAN